MNIFLIKIPVGFFVETEEPTVELTVIFMKKSRELGLAEVFLKAVRRASPGRGAALLSKVTVSETTWHRQLHRQTLCLTWAGH